MKFYQIKEGVGRIVKGVNTTPDVGPNEISKQAKKFGNTVDKDGRPPTLSKKVKGSKTNVLFNLGMTESVDKADESVLYYAKMAENLGELASTSKVYVDMDGVLADFFGEWQKLIGKDWREVKDIEPALQKIRDKDNFWLDLPLLPQAKNLLGVIKKVKGSYTILSSPLPNDPNSEPHKREWIKKNLDFFPPENVIITHDKPKYALNSDGTPNILIDDFGKNIASWEAAGGEGFKHKDHKFERTAKAIQQHMTEPAKERIEEGYKLHLERDDDLMVLHIVDTKSGKRTEVRGKPGYETGNYDPNDKLHMLLDKVGKSVDISQLMNGEPVGINPKHPQGASAKTATDKAYSENFADGKKKGVIKATKEDILAYKKIIGLAKKSLETNEIDHYFYDAVKITFDMNLYKKYPKLLSTLLKIGRKISKEDWPEIVQDIKKNTGIDLEAHISENFADGKVKGKSRPGRVKKSGASCNGSVTALRKRAKNSSGEKAKMYHWCANMKSGKKKG